MDNIELEYRTYLLTCILSDIDNMIDSKPIISYEDFVINNTSINTVCKNTSNNKIGDRKNE